MILNFFKKPKPRIISNEQNYCYLTDLKIIDDQLRQDIAEYAEQCKLNINPLPGVVSSTYEIDISTANSELLETARRFNSFNTNKPTELINYFKRFYLSTELDKRILANLPKAFRKSNFEIVLIVTNYGTPLHRDVTDRAIILCPIKTNDEITSFWEVKPEYVDQHEFVLNAFANPDLLEKKLDVVFKPGESWILNVDKIHAVEPVALPQNDRVIITFRWFDNTSIDDILKWFDIVK